MEPEIAQAIAAAVKAAGFRFVALDLEGYRTGSLNDRIPLRVIGLTSVPEPDRVPAPVRARPLRFSPPWTWLALAIGLVALLVHVVAGPGHLDDVDAINFTLGVRDFDVAQHQPHPPGYPVLIAAARSSPARRTRSVASAGWCRRPGPPCRSRPRRSRCWR